MRHNLIRYLIIASVKNEITYVKEIRIIREPSEPDLMAIKAKGIATIKKLIAPRLIPKNDVSEPADGIYELDFRMQEGREDLTNVDIEVEVIVRIKNLPAWVKGVKINASDNSDIELV